MKIFFDTEFIEDGRTIDLISIGMVRDDGAEYYAELPVDLGRANDWVKKNVIPHLGAEKRPRKTVAEEIKAFAGVCPEFWANYGAYDWVALCQLYGPMISIPPGWPMFVRDYQHIASTISGAARSFPVEGNDHNALDDARALRAAFASLTSAAVLL